MENRATFRSSMERESPNLRSSTSMRSARRTAWDSGRSRNSGDSGHSRDSGELLLIAATDIGPPFVRR